MQVVFTDRIGMHYKCVPISTAVSFLCEDSTYRKDVYLALEHGTEVISDNLGNSFPVVRVDRGSVYINYATRTLYGGIDAKFAFIPV